MSRPLLRLVDADTAAPLTVTIDPEPWRLYRESIACNPPETVALLGGSLDAPLHITDFFFLPPPRRGERFAHGAAHVELDHAAMNYLVDRVLVPNGKYMLGLWHSHPGGCTAPSEPDLRLCGAILRNDDSPGRRWPFFLAPITTFEADGQDRVTAWVLRKGAAAFEPALFATSVPAPAPLLVPDAARPTSPLLVEPVAGVAPDEPEPATLDPLAAEAAWLSDLLARPDGPVGVPRYRAGIHLHAAVRILACAGEAEPQP